MSQDAPDGLDQRLRVEALGEVAGTAGLPGAGLFLWPGVGGGDQDRDTGGRRLGLELAEQGEAVEPREVEVQKDGGRRSRLTRSSRPVPSSACRTVYPAASRRSTTISRFNG